MLRDADRSLASWLSQLLPENVGIRFEAPRAQWITDPPEPLFIDAFLQSVRQDGRGNQSGWSDVRDDEGRVIARQPAAQYYLLSYVVTAWAAPNGPEHDSADQVLAEHELLGVVIDACGHSRVLPDDCLEGTLAESGLKAIIECAPAEPGFAAAALWAGFGLPPRAQLELVLVAPARQPALTDLAPPARQIVLNAGQQASAATRRSGQATAGEPFGTVRRWEKQTITEPSPAGPPEASRSNSP